MRLTVVLLLSACLTASATGHSQTITLNLKNVPVQKVFREVIRQTGTSIIYNEAFFKNASPVTIKVKDAGVSEVLSECLKGLPFTYDLEGNAIVIKKRSAISKHEEAIVEPPLIDVHGRVVNEKGESLAGATVAVKGTRTATATDDNGEFILKNVDENAVLVISGVNIETAEVTVNRKSDLGILKLKTKIKESEEVVVEANTGYQKVNPNEMTGSITIMDNKTLNRQLGINIIDRLNGVTPGMLFENKIDNPKGYTIRGLSTINGPKSPLIIVDNFPYEGNITNINPNDVETITILKDAAASSIWGTSAGNGVIVITTKRGRFNAPLKISFNSNIVISTKPDLSKLAQMNSGDYIDVERYLFDQHYYDSYETSPSFPALSPAVEIFIKERDHLITSSEANEQINILKSKDLRNDLSKYMYRPSVNQQYAFDLRGGSENIAYLISAGYDNNVGHLTDKLERINLRVANTYQPAKNLQLTLSAFYTQFKSKSGKPGIVQMGGKPIPYLSIADENDSPLSVARTYRDSFTDTVGQGKLLDWKYYPLEDYKHNWIGAKSHNLTANLGISYEALSWLSLNLNYQMQREVSAVTNNKDIESYETRDLVNTFTQLDYYTGQVKYYVPKGTILTLSNGVLEAHHMRGQLNINKKSGQHSLTMITGTEIRQIKNEGNEHTVFGYNDEFATVGIVDAVNPLPTFFGGSKYIGSFPSFFGKANRFISLFG
ncbi:MAG: carboxypeptidase-like regulatory domain-containing protein, partial [Ginsengibacter sp.]